MSLRTWSAWRISCLSTIYRWSFWPWPSTRSACQGAGGLAYVVADRRLLDILGTCSIETPADLWKLLPEGHDWRVPFTTADIALRMGRPLWFAQRVAYCLRLSGAAREIGKRKRSNHQLYTGQGAPVSS